MLLKQKQATKVKIGVFKASYYVFFSEKKILKEKEMSAYSGRL